MKTLRSLDELVALEAEQAAAGHALFIRFSRGPKVDAKRGYSINHATGQAEAGLSCETLTVPEWWPVNGRTPRGYLAMQVASYSYMLHQGGTGTYAWLLTGMECGRGADNEPLVVDWTPLARVSSELVDEAVAAQM